MMPRGCCSMYAWSVSIIMSVILTVFDGEYVFLVFVANRKRAKTKQNINHMIPTPLARHLELFCLSATVLECGLTSLTYIHTLHYITLHYSTVQYSTLYYIKSNYITLQCITLHYIPTYIPTYIHTIPYHTRPDHTIPYHYITLHFISFHYISLHYIT